MSLYSIPDNNFSDQLLWTDAFWTAALSVFGLLHLNTSLWSYLKDRNTLFPLYRCIIQHVRTSNGSSEEVFRKPEHVWDNCRDCRRDTCLGSFEIIHPTLCFPWALLFACCKSHFVKALGGWLAGQCLKLLMKDDNLFYSIFTPIILGSAQAYARMEQVQTLPAFLLKGCWRSCHSLLRNMQRQEEQELPWKGWVKDNFEHVHWVPSQEYWLKAFPTSQESWIPVY